jgi:tetratricopeptide (TPR) repeat protein
MVRETVMALREADRRDEVPVWLMRQMIEHPGAMPAISRGWSIVIGSAQASPLTVSTLSRMSVPSELEPARLFALYRLASLRGQSVTAREALTKSNALMPALVRQWTTARMYEGPPDVDFTSQDDVVAYIEEFANEPDYLSASIGHLIGQKQDRLVLPALESVADRSPDAISVLSPLVAILRQADRRPEAINRIDRAATSVKSAQELYQLASLYTLLDEPAASEKMLRRANQVDPTHAATCNDLGYLLADTGRELDFAEDLLYRAVGADPDNPAYIDSLGWLLYKRGKFADARKYLEQALAASDPADAVVLDHAADAAYRTGDTDSAKRYWLLAIDQIRQQPRSADPQLRLKIEQKLQQLKDALPVDVAPIGK